MLPTDEATGVILVLGYVLAAWIGVACYFSTNSHFQWRFPLCLQSLWPLCMLALVPIIPESPRWCTYCVMFKLDRGHLH